MHHDEIKIKGLPRHLPDCKDTMGMRKKEEKKERSTENRPVRSIPVPYLVR